MKIKVKIPEEHRSKESREHFIDDILLWGMETEMGIAFYTFAIDPESTQNKRIICAIFSVEADYSYMFSLKWGATLYKGTKVRRSN